MADERRRRASVQATVRQLAAEGLHVEPVLDTYRLHSAEVGRVLVRVGPQEQREALRVVLEQLEDVGRQRRGVNWAATAAARARRVDGGLHAQRGA